LDAERSNKKGNEAMGKRTSGERSRKNRIKNNTRTGWPGEKVSDADPIFLFTGKMD